MATFIRWFDEITVGGKTASLGEMYRELRPPGVNVPNGFAITADAYWTVIDRPGIRSQLEEALSDLDKHDTAELARRGRLARALVHISEELWSGKVLVSEGASRTRGSGRHPVAQPAARA